MHQNTGRPMGVTKPVGQRGGDEDATNLPTLSVHNFKRLETFAGRYVDKSGKLVAGFYVKYGDAFYLDPNGPHWLGTLKELSKEHEGNAQAAYEQLTKAIGIPDIPTEDAVDVIAEETAAQPVAPPVDVDVLPAETGR